METEAYCPCCDGPAMLLGILGNLIHFRCRDCGVDWSDEAPEAEEVFA